MIISNSPHPDSLILNGGSLKAEPAEKTCKPPFRKVTSLPAKHMKQRFGAQEAGIRDKGKRLTLLLTVTERLMQHILHLLESICGHVLASWTDKDNFDGPISHGRVLGRLPVNRRAPVSFLGYDVFRMGT